MERVGKFLPIERHDGNQITYVIEYSTGEVGLYVVGFRNFATHTGLVFRGSRERLAELEVEVKFSGAVFLRDTTKMVPDRDGDLDHPLVLHAFAHQAEPPLV